MTLKSVIRKALCKLPLMCGAVTAIALASCESLYDNREDCVHGIELRFVFDYHMEPGANAFPSNVDCVDVFVFDKNTGEFLTQFKETTDELMSEHYRMELPLEEGEYHLMVYGGLACHQPAFQWENPSVASGAVTKPSDLSVVLPLTEGQSAKQLHDLDKRTGGLFYGTLDITVTPDDYGTTYTEYTVHLMKDTNNIQVILQELASPYQVDYNDYEFTIIDDNFKLDSDNNPVHIATDTYQPVYKPHSADNRVMGYVTPVNREGAVVSEDQSRPVQVGCAEMSTSRLFVNHDSSARLVITSKKNHDDSGNPKTIVDIPLITYLSATRGFGQGWIKSDQEYLDRQSNWTLMFFLQSGKWVSTVIAVNNWIVRVNDITLE